LIVIAQDLREFFNKHALNSIQFWDCPSNAKWSHYTSVDKETEKFNLTPILSCKMSWDFNKKEECDNIIRNWQMTFQASNLKGNHFLELQDNKYCTIDPFYIKRGPWFKNFGHSNSLCARATRAITNHAPIGEYHLKFFPRENFSCLCGLYPIETRQHILHEHRRFNKYWNPCRTSLSHFIAFLEFNPSAFLFHEGIT